MSGEVYSTYEEGMINTVVFYFDTKTRLRMTSLRNEKVYNSEEKYCYKPSPCSIKLCQESNVVRGIHSII